MLRIAVPNKGSLADTASEMLHEAGYTGRRDPKDLHVIDPQNEVEFFYLRPKDIATYVGSGRSTSASPVATCSSTRGCRVPARSSRSASATRRSASPALPAASRPSRTSRASAWRPPTPGLVDGFLDERGVAVDLVPLDGAVESAVRLGVADAVADVVSTGTTLKQAGLEIFGPVLLESEAVLIAGARRGGGHRDAAAPAPRRDGRAALRAHRLRPPARPVDDAVAVAPGIESPTISPLRDPEWVAVRVMSPRKGVNQVMDALYAIGARAILVTEIHAARL